MKIIISISFIIITILFINVYKEIRKPLTKETKIMVLQTEQDKQCYGEHKVHCDEFYQDLILKVR